MSSGSTVLVLDGVPQSALGGLGGRVVVRASSAHAARLKLSTERPAVVLAEATIPWHRLLLSTLSDERRPAVVAFGFSADVKAAWADEWMASRFDPGELAVRVRLATERAQARRQRSRRAYVDPLTRLPNRRAVIRALVREAARGRRGVARPAIVLMDLDGFKQVNEEMGHAEGDRLLRRVGAVLRRVTRGDEVCGRIGGDEFAIVVRDGRDAAIHAGSRAAEMLLEIGVRVTVATGELLPGETLRGLYRRVDEQLRVCKRARRAGHLVHAVSRSLRHEVDLAAGPSTPVRTSV